MYLKIIDITLSNDQLNRFNIQQNNWAGLQFLPGFLWQVGGYYQGQHKLKNGQLVLIAAAWRSIKDYQYFMDNFHDQFVTGNESYKMDVSFVDISNDKTITKHLETNLWNLKLISQLLNTLDIKTLAPFNSLISITSWLVIQSPMVKLEHIMFNAWPCKHQVQKKEVVLRSLNGFTKRANSANLFNTNNAKQTLALCDAFFKKESIKPVFRIPSFIDASEVKQTLLSSQYIEHEPSSVMQLSLANHSNTKQPANELAIHQPLEWLKLSSQLAGELDEASQKAMLFMLATLKEKALLASLNHNGQTVACGLGVLIDGHFGLFNLNTHKNFRQQGFATRLIKLMNLWAANKNGTSSYLQVVNDNHAAMSLYKKLGFTTFYQYSYFIKEPKA